MKEEGISLVTIGSSLFIVRGFGYNLASRFERFKFSKIEFKETLEDDEWKTAFINTDKVLAIEDVDEQ